VSEAEPDVSSSDYEGVASRPGPFGQPTMRGVSTSPGQEDLGSTLDALLSASPPGPDHSFARTRAGVDQALAREWVKLEVYRWFAATGRVPSAVEWSANEGCPTPAEVQELFGGWEQMLDASGVCEHPLVELLPRLGPALAEQRATHARALERVEGRERELARLRESLDQREQQMRARLSAEVESHAQQAQSTARTEIQARRAAEQRACDAELLAAQAREERLSAVRRAHTLMARLADSRPDARPVFAAWWEFPSGHFKELLSAATTALAGGELRKEILAVPLGASDVPFKDGFIEVCRSESANARSVKLTRSEPVLDTASCGESLAAHRRTTVTVWEGPEQAGVQSEVGFLDTPPVLVGGELAEIAARVSETATPLADAGWPLGVRATWVYEQEIDELLEFLESPRRARPVLALTSVLGGEPIDDPDRLAAELCGAAHVVRLDGPATFRLTERVGKSLSVWGDAARCYRPGFSSSSPPRKHPLFTAHDGAPRPGLHNELLLLVGAPVATPERFTAANLIAPPGTDAATNADYAEERSDSERVAALTAHIRDLQAALTERERHASELAQALACTSSPAAPETTDPRNVLEATLHASREARHLKFAPKAFKTAADSPFRPAGEIYQNLSALDQLAGEYIKGDLGAALGERALQLGLAWRGGVSEKASAKAPEDYTFAYEQHTLTLGPHVIVANGTGAGRNARIYFHVSDGSQGELPRGIYIGHVGRHLPDSTTS
jgi:hypothetical protein